MIPSVFIKKSSFTMLNEWSTTSALIFKFKIEVPKQDIVSFVIPVSLAMLFVFKLKYSKFLQMETSAPVSTKNFSFLSIL